MNDIQKNWQKFSLIEKRELLSQLLRQYAEQTTNVHEMSLGQRSLWYIHQLDPQSAAYNLLLALRIKSKLDKQVLKSVFKDLCIRHSQLRGVFKVSKGTPYQEIRDDLKLEINEVDFSQVNEKALLNRILQEFARQPFDLANGPVFKIHILNLGKDGHILLFVIHHIAGDSWSLQLLLGEFAILYQSKIENTVPELAPLKSQYFDFSNWQLDLLTGTAGEYLWDFWKEELKDAPLELNLPTDKPRPSIMTYNGMAYPVNIDREMTANLQEIARKHNTTLFTLTLAAFQVLIHLWTQQNDFLIGCPTSGRTKPEFENTLGYFVNSVVFRAKFKQKTTFSDFLKEQWQRVQRALEHQEFPFLQLVQKINPERDPSRSPVFQVSFQFERIHFLNRAQFDSAVETEFQGASINDKDNDDSTQFLNMGYKIKAGGLDMEYLDIPQTVGQFDLMFRLFNTGDVIVGAVDYNPDLFDVSTMKILAKNYLKILEAIIEDSDIPLEKLNNLKFLTQEGEIYTSSDFPMANLNQKDLNTFIKSIASSEAVSKDKN